MLAASPRPISEARWASPCPPPPGPARPTPGPAAAEGHAHFLEDDPLGVGRATEGVGLQRRAQMRLLVLLVVPLLVAAVAAQLTSGAETTALPCETWEAKVRRRSEARHQR